MPELHLDLFCSSFLWLVKKKWHGLRFAIYFEEKLIIQPSLAMVICSEGKQIYKYKRTTTYISSVLKTYHLPKNNCF